MKKFPPKLIKFPPKLIKFPPKLTKIPPKLEKISFNISLNLMCDSGVANAKAGQNDFVFSHGLVV